MSEVSEVGRRTQGMWDGEWKMKDERWEACVLMYSQPTPYEYSILVIPHTRNKWGGIQKMRKQKSRVG